MADDDTAAPEGTEDETPDQPTEEDIDWKAMARKHEREAKKAATELDRVRKANQSEQERAIEAAKGEGRTAALQEAGQKIAAAEIKAALSGIVANPTSIIEDLNLARYVTDDGEVDDEAVKALREKFVAAVGDGKKPPPSFDGGVKEKDAPTGGSFLQQALANRKG